MKTIIISQPKAGTYLCANLLVEFGLKQQPIHLNEWRYHLYIDGYPKGKKIDKPFVEAIDRIKDNQFAVTHIPAKPDLYNALIDFKKIVVLRPLEERLESHKRWRSIGAGRKFWAYESEWNLHNGKHHWKNKKGCFVIEFKDFKEYNIKKIDQMQRYLFGRVHYDSKACLTAAMDKDSLTKFTKK